MKATVMKPARHDALVTREGQQVLSWRTQRHMHTHAHACTRMHTRAHTWRAHTHLSIKAAHHKMLVGKAHDLVALLEHNLPGRTRRWRGLEAVPMAVDVVEGRQQQQAFGVVLRVLRRRGDTVANSKRGEAGVRLESVTCAGAGQGLSARPQRLGSDSRRRQMECSLGSGKGGNRGCPARPWGLGVHARQREREKASK